MSGGGEITRQQRDVQSRPETHVGDRDRAMQPALLHSTRTPFPIIIRRCHASDVLCLLVPLVPRICQAADDRRKQDSGPDVAIKGTVCMKADSTGCNNPNDTLQLCVLPQGTITCYFAQVASCRI